MSISTVQGTALGRRMKAIELRVQGYSYAEIARALGFRSKSGAHKAVTEAVAEWAQPDAQEVLAIETERLDELVKTLWPRALNGDDAAIDRLLKISAHRARLYGLGPDVRVELIGGVLDQFVASMGWSVQDVLSVLQQALVPEREAIDVTATVIEGEATVAIVEGRAVEPR